MRLPILPTDLEKTYDDYLIQGTPVCQNEFEHAQRAFNLWSMFTSVETLAEFLHQQYRAAAKSFKVPGPKQHDHGWRDCYGEGKRYFERRALWLLDPQGRNGRLR